jgi:hypothetical protein
MVATQTGAPDAATPAAGTAETWSAVWHSAKINRVGPNEPTPEQKALEDAKKKHTGVRKIIVIVWIVAILELGFAAGSLSWAVKGFGVDYVLVADGFAIAVVSDPAGGAFLL